MQTNINIKQAEENINVHILDLISLQFLHFKFRNVTSKQEQQVLCSRTLYSPMQNVFRV